jgi:hypothetical protein
LDLLTDPCGTVKPENKALHDVCRGLLALSDALQDEFVYLNNRLTYVEIQLANVEQIAPDGSING